MRKYCLLGLALLTACPPSIDTGDGGTGIINAGPQGGIFVRSGAVLNIPKGALSNEVQISVTVIDTGIPEIMGRKRISYGFRISPSALTFNQPIGLILPWVEDRVPDAVDPGTFDSRRQAGNDPYLQLSGAKTYLDQKAVEAQTDRLGLFWLTSPSEPNVSRLELDPKDDVFIKVGDTKAFTAKVIDPTGKELEAKVSWSVVPARAASIDGGLLTATGPGYATVTARAGSQSASTEVHIQGDTAGPQTFFHENPFPTGNDLWGGTLAPGGLGVVFVGANTTLLAVDGLGNWTRFASGPGVTLKAIAGTTANNAVAVGVTGTTGVLAEMQGADKPPKVTLFPTAVPLALWYDGTTGMAVGTGNDVLMRANGAWAKEYSPSFETLYSVIGDGAGSFVVVGERGSIYKYDPALHVWNSLYQSQLAVRFTTALLTDATGGEAWAWGGNKLWHFSSGAWTALNMPATPVLTEATAIGLIDDRLVIAGRELKKGWAFTVTLAAALGSADAGSGGPLPPGWTLTALRAPQIPRGFFGGGASSTQGYLVGDLGSIYQYVSPGAFNEISHGFYGSVADVAAYDGGVFAAVNDCANTQCSDKLGTVYKRFGQFNFQNVGQVGGFAEILSAVATGPNDVVISTSSGLFHHDGVSWSPVSVSGGTSGPIFDLKWCGADLLAVGKYGGFYKGTSSQLTRQTTLFTDDLAAIDCSATEQWAAGDGVFYSKSGTQNWAPRDDPNLAHGSYLATWTPGLGEGLAFGNARFGVYWNTQELKVIDGPGGVLPDEITGLWGSGMDNLYAVGQALAPFVGGYAIRFNGAQWLPIDLGASRKATSLSGTNAVDIWVGTEGGGVLHGVAPK